MQLDLATAEFIGARAQQQDHMAAQRLKSNLGALLILGDGLGGHEGGQEASHIVVDTFVDAANAGAFDAISDRRTALRQTLEAANNLIAGGVNPAHGQRSMASTAVAAVVADGMLSWVSVGDSHLYVWRSGRLFKLNQDHSQAGLMVRSGQYQPNDPEVLAAKSVLVSALTGRKLDLVDWPKEAFKVEKGDVLLLASDGLNTLTEQEVEVIVTEIEAQGAKKLSATLLETVKDRRVDRQDNTTVVVARVLDVPTDKPRNVPMTDLEAITTARLVRPADAVRTEVAPSKAVTQRAEPTTMRTVPSLSPSPGDGVLHPGPITEPRGRKAGAGRSPLVSLLRGVFVALLALTAVIAVVAVLKPELASTQTITGFWEQLRAMVFGARTETPVSAPQPAASQPGPAQPAAVPTPNPRTPPAAGEAPKTPQLQPPVGAVPAEPKPPTVSQPQGPPAAEPAAPRSPSGQAPNVAPPQPVLPPTSPPAGAPAAPPEHRPDAPPPPGTEASAGAAEAPPPPPLVEQPQLLHKGELPKGAPASPTPRAQPPPRTRQEGEPRR